MKFSNTERATFKCSLERAFKTPILGDATKILTGFLFIPPITGFRADKTWGLEEGSRIPYSNGNLFSSKGAIALDRIITRMENKYWQWELIDFKQTSLFFLDKAVGEYWCHINEDGLISVKWTYSFFPKSFIYNPLVFLLTRVWSGLQKRALENIKYLAETNAPYVYDN